MAQSGFERNLEFQMKAVKVPAPVIQYRFAPPRKWTFDFCWPDRMLALEVEGGIWTKGRHTRGKGYEKDCEKYNEAALRGFRLLRVTTGMVKDGRALKVVETAIQASGVMVLEQDYATVIKERDFARSKADDLESYLTRNGL